jgi:probable H4MPT-linked C1 transfer pathway protein
MFGLLIDVGSTTTDIIPLSNSGPCPIGLSDTDRLLSGELVYTGVGRTPVCAITRSLPWRGKRCPVAAEYFATSADAYVILGQLAERADMNATADGRPLTKEFAHERLARMFCADASAFSKADAEVVAGAVREAQEGQLEAALRQVGNSLGRNPEWLVFSGTGEFLALSLAQRMFPAAVIISLAQRLGNDLSEAAPAYAVAVLAGEMG